MKGKLIGTLLIGLNAVSAFTSIPVSRPISSDGSHNIRSFSKVVTKMSFSPNASTSSTGGSTSESLNEARKLIANAISIGAPAYNTGDIQECARVYKATALDIISSNLLPPSASTLKSSLEQTIQTNHENDNEEAWAFRRQFDAIMEYQVPFMPDRKKGDGDASASSFSLEKFSDNVLPSQPLIVHDNVMGGISQGGWDASSNTFSGTTSLANNGGFASLRWRMNNVQNWSYAKGLYLKGVKHTKPSVHTFRIILKDMTCEQVRGANFKNVFCNPYEKDGMDEPLFIPFDEFDQMEQMGRQLQGPVFNRGAVTEIGLMAIKPTVIGEFELSFEEWGIYY